jgi:hypothetical protein
MKSISIVIFSFILFSNHLLAQNRLRFHHNLKAKNLNIPQVYKGKIHPLIQSSVENQKADTITLVYKNTKGQQKKIVGIPVKKAKCVLTLDKGIPVVDFWQLTIWPSDINTNGDTIYVSPTMKLGDWRYEIDLYRPTVGSPTRLIKVNFSAWSFGVGTVPFRIRQKVSSNPMLVTTNLNFIFNFGRTWGFSKISNRAITNYSLSVGPFIGAAPADLKKIYYKDPSLYKADQTNFALTYGGNLIFARNNFGLVLSMGFDTSIGPNSSQWLYQNKLWYGLGINTSLGFN